jgi:cardiolipin synthase (CMP-forming)
MNKITIANLLTFTRLILTFVFIYLLSQNKIFLAIVVLLIAGLSDILDGFAARKLNQVTTYGIFLTLTSLSLLGYGYIDLTILLLFLAGGAIRSLSYIKKDKINPTKWSKAVVVIIYFLIILSLTSQELFNIFKWPAVVYHIVISSVDLYRK